MTPEMAAMMRALGASEEEIAAAAAGGAGGIDSDDPPIPVSNPRIGTRGPKVYPMNQLPTRAGAGGRGAPKVKVPGGGASPSQATKPRSQVIAEFYGWDEQKLRTFQEKAFAAGLYQTTDRADVRWGDFDANTFEIWQEMVDRSAGYMQTGRPITPDQALDMAANAAANDPDAGPKNKRAPLTVSVANPADLRAVFDSVAQSLLGRRLDGDQLGRLVNAYQALDRQAQEEQYAITDPEGAGGTMTEAPDPTAFAREQLTIENPEEVAGQDVATRFNTFFDMLRGVV